MRKTKSSSNDRQRQEILDTLMGLDFHSFNELVAEASTRHSQQIDNSIKTIPEHILKQLSDKYGEIREVCISEAINVSIDIELHLRSDLHSGSLMADISDVSITGKNSKSSKIIEILDLEGSVFAGLAFKTIPPKDLNTLSVHVGKEVKKMVSVIQSLDKEIEEVSRSYSVPRLDLETAIIERS